MSPALATTLWGQSALSGTGIEDSEEFFVTLDTFVKYGGDIAVIDGITGQPYHSGNKVVKTIYENLPKIMGGLHKMLLELEIKHMKYQISQGGEQERQLVELLESFGVKNFKLDRSLWLIREKAVLARLQSEPFFQIKELIVWEEDELDWRSPPESKYARNLRYNEEMQSWERRILTEWNVISPAQWDHTRLHFVVKYQGLNLETNKGFHIIRDSGLPNNIHPSHFKEVPVSLPIFVSRKGDPDAQIDRLQRNIVENLSHLYDPFTWIARRATRFRGVFSSALRMHFEERRRFRVSDREWFDPVMVNFFNDVVTHRVHGLGEIYDLYITQRFEMSENALGEELDLLNWHPDEKRTGSGAKKEGAIWINFNNPNGARFILLDLYLRYGDKFIDSLRAKLADSKRGQVEGKKLVEEAIVEVSGHSAEVYIKAAAKAQKAGLEAFRRSKTK